MELIKESLKSIDNPRYEEIYKTVEIILNNYEEEQIQQALTTNGIYLSERIMLHFIPYYGFRCFNLDQALKGRDPICPLLEKKLNQRLNILAVI